MKKQPDTSEQDYSDDFDLTKSLSRSLARQVQEEMDTPMNHTSRQGHNGKKHKRKKKKGRALKIIATIILLMSACVAFLIFTKPGRDFMINLATEYAYNKINYTGKDDPDSADDTDLLDGELTPNVSLSLMSDTFRNARHEEGVYNILLLGLEAIESKGHTDSIMIATLNTKTKKMKLTSLMRDSWVTIPGYGDDRINVAYAKGGINTLYETIALNYDIQLDGYALVGFDTFEQIIDALGGIELELTDEEAYYLNHTNYISNKSYRNVVAGKQRVNGNQALGYCRVRKVATLDGSNNDMGRTSRHRRVMNSIFSELKTASIPEMLSVVNTVLPLVETDIRKNNCKVYLSDALEIGLKDMSLDNLRLPEDGCFDDTTIDRKRVLVPHWEETKAALHSFIFDPDKPELPAGAGADDTTGQSETPSQP